MSHKKSNREVWQHRFNLSSDNQDDVRLHEYLRSLAGDGEAAEWMRKGLTSLIPYKYNGGTTVVQHIEEVSDVAEDEPRYVDIDTGA